MYARVCTCMQHTCNACNIYACNICACNIHACTHARQRLMGRLPEVHETSERDLRQLQQRARLTELQLETVYEGIKVM
jgi:hypothetical protein